MADPVDHETDDLSDKEFARLDGSKCPFCKSEEITPGKDWGLRRDHFFYGMRCQTCGEQWDEIYTLSGWQIPITYNP